MFIQYNLDYGSYRHEVGVINTDNIMAVILNDDSLDIIFLNETITFYSRASMHVSVLFDGLKDVLRDKFCAAFPGIGFIERL